MTPDEIIAHFDAQDFDSQHSGEVAHFREKLEWYFNTDRKSHERKWNGLAKEVIQLSAQTRYDPHFFVDFLENHMQKYEHALGYRDNVLTFQEMVLLEGGDNSHGAMKTPYLPLCLLEQNPISFEEVQHARKLMKYFSAYNSPYFDIPGHKNDSLDHPKVLVNVLLEELDFNTHMALCDPRPVDSDFHIFSEFTRTEQFPYQRNT